MLFQIFEFLTAPGLQARFKKVKKKRKNETQRRRTHRRIPREIRATPHPQQHSKNSRWPPETQKGARARSDRKVAVLCKAVNTKGVTFREGPGGGPGRAS